MGGQFPSQAAPPDEDPWIESFGCTRLYGNFRDGVRDYYRRHYPLTADARGRPYFNPGNGNVSKLCHEPRVALAVLQEMLAPYQSSGRVKVLLRYKPIAADPDRDRVRSVTVRELGSGHDVTLEAPYFIDATELGDLLPLTKTEFVTGFESRKQTQEPHAAGEAQPLNQQAFTWCFAVDYLAGEDHTIAKPAEYAFWRSYVPEMKPAWTGPLLNWKMPNPITLAERAVSFDPTSPGSGLNLWLYRRIADRKNFAEGTYRSDISLVNWPQHYYWLRPP